MQISLRTDIAKSVVSKSKCLDDTINHWTLEKLKKGELAADDSITVNLLDLKKQNLIELQKVLTSAKAPQKTITTVSTWIENINNPHNAIVTSLPALEKMLIAALKDNKPYWVMKTNPDGILVPYAVKEIKYKNRYRDEEAYVYMQLVCIKIKIGGHWDDESTIELKADDTGIHFYKDTISKAGSDEDFISNFVQNEKATHIAIYHSCFLLRASS